MAGTVSGTGKQLLDSFCERLEFARPKGIKVAIAKGIARGIVPSKDDYKDGKSKWELPDSIIKDNEYTLFKHIIINEHQIAMSDSEVNEYILLYFESGIRTLMDELSEMTTLEDSRIKILG